MTTSADTWLKQAKFAYRRQITVLAGFAVSEFTCRLAGCFWLAGMLAELLEYGPSQSLKMGLITLASAWSLATLLAALRLRLQINLRHHCLTHIQTALHRELAEKQLPLVKRFSSYQWHQLWVNDSQHISAYLTEYLPQQTLAAIAPILVLALTASINWLVALALLLTLPLVILFMMLFGGAARSLQEQHWQALTRLGAMFSDRLQALPALMLMRAHQPQQLALNRASETLNERTQAVVGVAFLSSTTIEFVTTLIMAIVAVFAGFSILGEIQLGPTLDFTAGLELLLVTPLLLAELRLLARYYHQKAAAVTAAEKILTVLANFPQHAPASNPQPVTDTVFTSVSWPAYEVSVPNLRARCLTITAGQHIHIDGVSGSGKTALLEALMGWREANHGKLAGQVAMLSQRPVIAATSVRANLTLAAPEANDAEIKRVLNAVHMTDWLAKLASGLDTTFTEIPPLSGGEAQRLCLARVLLSDAQVILLDEPTAHLPADLHWELVELIESTCGNKTVLWASHKPLTPYFFDTRWHILPDGQIHCEAIGR